MLVKGVRQFRFRPIWRGNVRLSPQVRRREETSVTVIIGALCGVRNATQTGNVILCADNLITYSVDGVPATSNERGTKIFDLPMGFYAAIADDISRCLHAVSYLWQKMSEIDAGDTRRIDLVKMAVLETGEYMRLWMRREILARHGVSLDEYLHDRDLACRSDIAREIAEESMPTQLIVGGFSQSGSPFLLYTDCVNVQEQTNPGFFCGGAGAVQALDWLNLRGQNGFMSIQRTAYHVHEAKRFAELSPVVGGTHHVLLLQHGQEAKNIGTNQAFLGRWLGAFYPRSTEVLDRPHAWDEFSNGYDL